MEDERKVPSYVVTTVGHQRNMKPNIILIKNNVPSMGYYSLSQKLQKQLL